MSRGVHRRSRSQPGRAFPGRLSQGDAKRSTAGDGEAVPPEACAARRRKGIEARRGETLPAARCAARKPGPPGRRPKKSNDHEGLRSELESQSTTSRRSTSSSTRRALRPRPRLRHWHMARPKPSG
ncbi:hypothetical protein F5985_09915 [Malikia spinosa]|uniref:Uncharacterized protein n=1 Tax=Malikia spinosa TaxID=86180 RepID=A0A7C9N2Y1_9BURK|nr:hypothetical protein [Malikia spinosa]